MKLSYSFQNLLQPVHRLPPEILSRIIQYVPHNDDTDARSTIPLTHVCRYWREFTTSTPRNWTLISDKSKCLAALSLQRAKAAPLQLRLRKDRVEGFPELINPYIQNVKTLHFSGFKTVEELAQTFPNFPQSMPGLQSLTLARLKDASLESDSADPFESFAQGLRCLKLVGVPLYPSFLRLRALTELALKDHTFGLHLDTLLDFLEENRSLESAILDVRFTEPSLRSSLRGACIANQLQHLSINATDPSDAKALASSIALRRGADLEIVLGRNAGLETVLSRIPTAQFSNFPSPIFIECESDQRSIRLLGPNGSFSFRNIPGHSSLLAELPKIRHLTDIKEFRFIHNKIVYGEAFRPSIFPALEAFAIACERSLSRLFSTLFSNPSFSPSLKTLAFLDCDLSEEFMGKLIQFVSNRKNTTSAWLRRIVIVNSRGNFPTISSIEALGEHVPIVNVSIGKELPTGLT